MTTPAQAYGHPNFVTDVPVQGPTDLGIRSNDCLYVQNMLPTRSACVDCSGGPIPMWAKQSLSQVRGKYSGIGGDLGFALAGPDIWQTMSPDQQKWIVDTLVKINSAIMQKTGTVCPTWAPNIMAAGQCFQGWFNAQKFGFTKPDGSPVMLQTNGIFDQDTLDALRTVVALHPSDFPTPFPGTQLPGLTGTGEKKLSTAAMVGIGAAAVGLAGIIYAATSGKKRRSKTREARRRRR